MNGETARSSATTFLRISTVSLISFSVLKIPTVNLNEPVICSRENPIDSKTWEDFWVLTEHAEPVEAATPYSSSFIMRSSPLTPRKVKWALLDKRN